MMHNRKLSTDPPGKIKHNLNIDVFALLPGSRKQSSEALSKRAILQSPQRSVSLDLEQGGPDSWQSAIPFKDTIDGSKETITDNVEVLKSLTKTRPKGPVKRRPSTKRGRDAMRNTCSDFSFIRNSTAEDCENEANDDNSNEKPSSKSELQAKTTEHPKLISTQSQHTSIEKKQSLRYAFPRQHVKETYQINIIRPENDLSPGQLINYSDMKLGLHNVVKSEYIPKIIVETSRSVEGNTRASEFKSHLNCKNDDILTYSTTTEKVTNKTEDCRRLPEISPSRSRRFERWHEFKAQQTQQTTFKSEVSMKLNQNLGDVPKITVSSSVSSNITDFMNELITDERSLDKAVQDGITHSRTTTNFLRRSEYVTKLSKTSSLKRTDFLNELDSIYNSSGNKDRKGVGDNITSTRIVKQSEKNDNGIEVQEETLNSNTIANEFKVEMCPNGRTLVNENRKTEDSFKSTVETSYNKTTPKNVVSRIETSLSANSKDYLIFDSETSGPFDVSRRSSFVKTDNFASPEFIKENLSEDEEGEDVFSEKKLPPQSDILKRSTLDDDEEDLLEEESKDKKTVGPATLISRKEICGVRRAHSD